MLLSKMLISRLRALQRAVKNPAASGWGILEVFVKRVNLQLVALDAALQACGNGKIKSVSGFTAVSPHISFMFSVFGVMVLFGLAGFGAACSEAKGMSSVSKASGCFKAFW
jgi:hypothetical protein